LVVWGVGVGERGTSCYRDCVLVFVRVYGHVIRAEPVAECDRKEFTIYYVLAFKAKWLPYAPHALT